MSKYPQIIGNNQPANLLTVMTCGGRMPLDTVNIPDVDCFIYMTGQEVYEHTVFAREVAGIAGLE